jgi:hypothetical protein
MTSFSLRPAMAALVVSNHGYLVFGHKVAYMGMSANMIAQAVYKAHNRFGVFYFPVGSLQMQSIGGSYGKYFCGKYI